MMLSFNLIKQINNQTFIYYHQKSMIKNINVLTYVQKLCLYSGSSLQGSLMASAKLLEKSRKLPIFLAKFDDYLIPLASPLTNNCCWFSAKNYLRCFEENNRFYIKFKDRSIIEVHNSIYSIKSQYNKYLDLDEKRNELVKQIFINEIKEDCNGFN